MLSFSLERNIALLKKRLSEDITLKCHRFTSPGGIQFCLFFCDGMVDSRVINESILRPLLRWECDQKPDDVAAYVDRHILNVGESRLEDDVDELCYAVVYGDTLLLCEDSNRVLVLGSKGFAKRSIGEPPGEIVSRGPREGFVEPLLQNISLLKRKIRSEKLKFESIRFGSETQTTCCICYLEGVADEKVLKELRERLRRVKMDSILGANYITEMIRDCWWTPFRTVGTTERPDTVAAKLCEGRVAILIDGTPVVLTVPHILLEMFQASDDYYVSAHFAAICRVLRMIGFAMSLVIVPFYVAIITFHPQVLPTALLFSISEAREGVPFSTIVECLGLLLALDLLREAGTRTPSNIGLTLSVVGALVLGQAAVEARFVSAPMVIVVAFSGITGLMTPKLKGAVIIIQLMLFGLSATLGLFGFVVGLIWVLLHLCSLESFGVPVISSMPLYSGGSHEDSLVRLPFNFMRRSGRFLASKGARR